MGDRYDSAEGRQNVRKDLGPITAAIYDDRCLVLRIPDSSRWFPRGFLTGIVLCDIRTGRPFAHYGHLLGTDPLPAYWDKSPLK